ncbi:MAG: Hsp20 family protein [Verrucomicrobiae bacterium]|nr:Hsp20 family protein [Verrucomicrobiae bacterium]
MRPIDFTPLFRSTVGFDRLIQLLDAAGELDRDSGYPPYNIERTGEQEYRISMAVAGFSEPDLKIELKEHALTVRGEKVPDGTQRHYLHRGIGQRAFERRFQLADHVEVTGAKLVDGMLHIELVRNLPERMKPRTIAISSVDGPARDVKQIEATAG